MCIVWYIFRTLAIIENSNIFNDIHVRLGHIEAYCLSLCNSCIFRALGIFRTWDTFKYIYSGIVKTPCNVQILRTLPYSEFWCIWDPIHIQNPVYIGICRHFNDNYNNINFLFFALTLHTFQRNLERQIFWPQWSMLDWIYLNNKRFFKIDL